eukprot:m.91011 g.91011  ORF g.91011 m.91011 type:complete len:652 (+) comp15289_c0_seq1:13-1968(+)
MASLAHDAARCAVPPADHVRVEFPGYVASAAAATAALGGAEAVAHAQVAEGRDVLQLRLRPESESAHPVRGTRGACCSLLLRLRTKRRRADEAAGGAAGANASQRTIVDCTVVARAAQSFAFTELCDFQYMHDVSLKDGALRLYKDDPWTTEDVTRPDFLEDKVPLCMLPPQFSIDLQQNPYRFQASTTDRSKPDSLPILEVRFDEPTPAASYWASAKVSPAIASLKDELQAKFDERPIWSRQSICAAFPTVPWLTLRRALHYITYRFAKGPWRMLLVRLGHDPRLDPSSMIYQCINVRLRHPSAPQKDPASVQPSHVYTSEQTLMNCDPTFQFCDIREPALQKMIAEAEINEACNEKSGWVSDKLYSAVRRYMKLQMQRNTKRGDTAPAEASAAAAAAANVNTAPSAGSKRSVSGSNSGPSRSSMQKHLQQQQRQQPSAMYALHTLLPGMSAATLASLGGSAAAPNSFADEGAAGAAGSDNDHHLSYDHIANVQAFDILDGVDDSDSDSDRGDNSDDSDDDVELAMPERSGKSHSATCAVANWFYSFPPCQGGALSMSFARDGRGAGRMSGVRHCCTFSSKSWRAYSNSSVSYWLRCRSTASDSFDRPGPLFGLRLRCLMNLVALPKKCGRVCSKRRTVSLKRDVRPTTA